MLAIDQRNVPSQSVRISTRFLGSKAYVRELIGAKKISLKKKTVDYCSASHVGSLSSVLKAGPISISVLTRSAS